VKIALIGCGNIGEILARAIERGDAGRVELTWVLDRTVEKCEKFVQKLHSKPSITTNLGEIIADREVDLVVEAASQAAVTGYAIKVLEAGKDLMVMSVGALADEKLLQKMMETAERKQRKVYIPSGAILGIDGIRAAKLAGIDEVVLTTRKPAMTLAYSSYIKERRIDLGKLREPMVVFEGPAKEAVKAFPASVNVAATLSLSGIGFERTKVRIVADPTLDRNIHEVHIKSKGGEFFTQAKNLPSPDNPKTSYLAALSAVQTLANISSNFKLGT
jgi:aspartate dehydrogenase